MEKLTFKIRGEKRETLSFDNTSVEISDILVETDSCHLTIKQKITGKILLRAFNVEYWYLHTLRGPSK